MPVDRKTYTRQVNPISFPSVQFPQYTAQAEMFQEIGKRIDVIKEFAISQGTEEAIEKGKEFGLTNPINMADFLNSDPVSQESFLSTGPTAFDKAADAVRINILTTDIETASLTQLNEIAMTANSLIGTEGEPTKESLAALMYGIIDGNTQALASDPDAAQALYSSLTTKANTLYKNYLDNVETEGLEQLKASGLARAYEIKKMIPDFIDVGDSMSADEQEILRFEDSVAFLIQEGKNKMRSVGVSEQDIIDWELGVVADVESKAKDSYFLKYIPSTATYDPNKTDLENATDLVNQTEKAFGGRGEHVKLNDSDDMAKRLFDIMGTQRTDFLDSLRIWYNAANTKFENRSKVLDDKAAAATSTQLQIIRSELSGDNPDKTAINNAVDILQDLSKKDPVRYLEAYEEAVGMTEPFSGALVDDSITTFDDVILGIRAHEIDEEDLKQHRKDFVLTGGPNGTFIQALNELDKVKDESVIAATNIIRDFTDVPRIGADGVPLNGSPTFLGATQDERNKKRATDAALQAEFYKWLATNPDATRADMLDEAFRLTTDAGTIAANQDVLNQTAVNISQITPTNFNNNVQFRDAVNQYSNLPEGVVYSNYISFANEHPELFEKHVIGTLERILDGDIKVKRTALPGYKPLELVYSKEDTIKLLNLLEEYIGNDVFKDKR